MKRATFLFKIKGWVVVHPTCLHQGGRRHTSLWACRGAAETTALPRGLLCFHLCKWEEKRHDLSPEKTQLPCWQLLPHPHSWILANNARHGAEAPSLAVFRHFYHICHNFYTMPGVPSTQPGKRGFTNKLELDESNPHATLPPGTFVSTWPAGEALTETPGQ